LGGIARLDDSNGGSAAATRMEFDVKIARDRDLGVWYVCDSAIPGLNAEAATFDELVEIITDLVPDLVAANHLDPHGTEGVGIPVRIEHLVHAKLAPACLPKAF